MKYETTIAGCPFAHDALTQSAVEYEQAEAPEGMPQPDELQLLMFDWYQKTGFRGCLFNKVAARNARAGNFDWPTPVEYGLQPVLLASASYGTLNPSLEMVQPKV